MKDVSPGLSPPVRPESIVPQLELWLRDTSDEIGSAAAKALATLGQPGRNALLTALEDIDSRAVYRAIGALRECDDPQFVAAAMRLLRDKSPDVRAGAVEALGATRTTAALEAIIGALGDPHGMVCRVAIGSLGQFEDSSLAREQLLSFLGDDSDVFCKAAAESLVRHGVKALEPLLDILASESVGKARRWAAYALGRTRDATVVNPLIETLEDDDSALRSAVVESLGYIGDNGAFDAVLSALHDSDRGVRLRAATALGAIGDQRAFEMLLAYVTGPDKGMARCAAVGLGKLRDVRAINPLLDTIREGWLLDSTQALYELSHDNSEAIPYLLAALEDEHMEVRASALDALSVVGATSAFEPALRAFHRAEDETRWRALPAIDRIDAERAMPYLISALADPTP
jgi:HEAT repeat protein